MPVSSVTRMWSRYASSLTRQEKKKIRTINDAYQIVHDATDDRLDIEFAAGVPRVDNQSVFVATGVRRIFNHDNLVASINRDLFDCHRD